MKRLRMMDNKVKVDLKAVFDVCDKTIGSELASVKPDKDWEVKKYKQLCESLLKIIEDRHVLADDEYLAEGFEIDGGAHYWISKKPLKVDESKDWKLRLVDEDWSNLAEHNLDRETLENWNGNIGIADRDDDILIIKTDWNSWAALAGREWYYNLKTKEFTLNSMN